MQNNTDLIYVFWSAASRAEAQQIARALLDQRLIACATLFPEVESIYRWEGNIEESSEVKVILKTRKEHFEAIEKSILAQGSYAVPEIAQVEITRANPRYVSWALEETLI
jgi:periplasmic divalent cation tolerance protein